MPVRAVWHAPVAVDEYDDVFGERIEEVGVPIVLSADGETAELCVELVTLVQREAQLDEDGVTCPIKDRPGSSCHACPLHRADGSRLAELCWLGREQERLSTLILVHRHGG